MLGTVQRVTRLALLARGVSSRRVATSVGACHAFDAPGQGKAPPVVLLHGIGSSASSFGRVILDLKARVRHVVAPDAPGHGLSPGPSLPLTPTALAAGVTETFSQLLDEPAVLFGCSLGGAVALRYTLANRERVRGLVLCSPGGAPTESLAELFSNFDLTDDAKARDFLVKLFHRPPWYMPLLVRDVRRIMSSPPIRQFFSSASQADLLTPRELKHLDVPVLLLWGQSERLLPREHLRFFREHLPAHARIEQPERFGHSPHVERPLELARKIADFAASLG
jgi:pimeloyl-ACP methyl ester carboxylesterase